MHLSRFANHAAREVDRVNLDHIHRALSRPSHRLGRLIVTALTLGGLMLCVPAASAAPSATGPMPAHAASGVRTATVIPGTHDCENFGGNSSAGFRAGHCADIDQFINSIGLLAVRGQGQAFCQGAAEPHTIVQCAGISQLISITNLDTRETMSSNPVCGRYGGSACPSGRFQNLSPGIYAFCGDTYSATVRTTIVLPVDAQVSRSGDFTSHTATLNC